ncbi:MAG: citrulline utilization hydrolase CtlX [Steroidobacteraceae bacterium]
MALLLVEPAAFGFNAETATTNRFQQSSDRSAADVAAQARAEFHGLVAALRGAGIALAIAPDDLQPPRPDAVFPNNWVSFHRDGSVVLYPMRDPTRRAERREAVLDCVKQQLGFVETRRIDLSGQENQQRYLEGTGSLVLDHAHRIAYACRSPRTDETLVREWAALLGYEPCLFDAATHDGAAVYHTNVLLWIGAGVVGVGLEWVAPAQREALRAKLGASGRRLLLLDNQQLLHFAGNMLEVSAADGQRHLVMSASAHSALRAADLELLRAAGSQPLVAAIPTIEQLGGGSVRCMLAEVPLAMESSG